MIETQACCLYPRPTCCLSLTTPRCPLGHWPSASRLQGRWNANFTLRFSPIDRVVREGTSGGCGKCRELLILLFLFSFHNVEFLFEHPPHRAFSNDILLQHVTPHMLWEPCWLRAVRGSRHGTLWERASASFLLRHDKAIQSSRQ